VTRLCDALVRAGVPTAIVTGLSDGAEVLPRESGISVRRTPAPGWQAAFGGRAAFGDTVREAAGASAAVVHDHGLWLPENAAVAYAARRAGAPLVVALKGMASPWALRHRRLKKKAAWWAYQRRALALADVLQVSSSGEVEDVRRLGLGAPVALVPYGVEPPPEAVEAERGPVEAGPRRALFLSRIHPVKGLPLLVEAWARVRPQGWELVVAGPDEGGHRAEVERLVREAGLDGAVSFTGPVADGEKWALYRSASLFVLPTHTENFGIVVAEALAAGVPVLTTRGAPWAALERERCGWWTDVSADGVAGALAEATALPAGALREAGERGRRYARRELSWDRAAVQTRALYAWLLGRGERPDCVVSA
jgi:glycosyltransferase involved in cell wall biosynthesis